MWGDFAVHWTAIGTGGCVCPPPFTRKLFTRRSRYWPVPETTGLRRVRRGPSYGSGSQVVASCR